MATEEVFGPALPIWRVRGSRRGDRARECLAVRPRLLGVDARSRARPRRRPTRIEAGYTWINSRTKVYDELPFGGWKS